MAAAIEEGARADDSGIEVWNRHVDQAQAQDLLDADAVVFVAAENLAALSGKVKDYFDRSYYHLLDRCNGKPYAAVICAGSDGQNALRQLERIATGLRLRAIAPARIVITHAQTPEAILAPKQVSVSEREGGRELGQLIAAGLVMGLF